MLLKAPHGTITDASPAEAVRLQRLGWTPLPTEPDNPQGPPEKDAPLEAWITYANLLDLDVEGMSKPQIIEKVG